MFQGGKNTLTVKFGPLSRRPDYAGSGIFVVWMVNASHKAFSSANRHLSRELLGSKPIVCKHEMKAMVVNIVESWRSNLQARARQPTQIRRGKTPECRAQFQPTKTISASISSPHTAGILTQWTLLQPRNDTHNGRSIPWSIGD